MNRNLIVGIAAGAAAFAVAGIIARRNGSLETLVAKIRELADRMERFDFEKFGIEDVIPKGEDKNVSRKLTATN